MTTNVRVRIEDRWFNVEIDNSDPTNLRVLVDGIPVDVSLEKIAVPDPQSKAPLQTKPGPSADMPDVPASATKIFRTPMPGSIISISVERGDQVITGDEICVLESMKMQQSLRADWSGIVKTVHVQAGQQVLDGDPIVDLE